MSIGEYKIEGIDNSEMLLDFYNEFQTEEEKVLDAEFKFDDEIEQTKISFVLNYKNNGKNYWSNDQLVALLSDTSSMVRYCAANTLYEREISSTTFQSICDLANSKDEEIRESCAQALDAIRSFLVSKEKNSEYHQAFDILLKFCEDESLRVRQTALSALPPLQKGKSSTSENVTLNPKLEKIICEAATDSDAEIRSIVAIGLGEGPVEFKKTVELLNKYRLDEDQDVVNDALSTLEYLITEWVGEDALELNEDQAYDFLEAIEGKNISYEEMVDIAQHIKEQDKQP